MLKRLIRPACWLSQKLGFRSKFSLIVAVTLFPCLFLIALSLNDTLAQLQIDKQESIGLQKIGQLHELWRMLDLHRQQSEQIMRSSQVGKVDLNTTEATIDQEFRQVLDKASQTAKTRKNLDNAFQQWNALKAGWRGMTAVVGFHSQSKIIQLINDEIYAEAGDSGLLNDAEPSVYFSLISMVDTLPVVREQLAKSGALLNEITASGKVTDFIGNELDHTTNVTLEAQLHRLESNLGLLLQADPNGYASIGKGAEQFISNMHDQQKSINSKIIDDQQATAAKSIQQATQTAMSQNDQMYSAFNDMVRAKLKIRIESPEHGIIVRMGIAASVILIAIYLVLGFSIDVNKRLRELMSLSSALEKGKLNMRMRALGSDEVSKVLSSLNDSIQHISVSLQAVDEAGSSVNAAALQIVSVSTKAAQVTLEQNATATSMTDAMNELNRHIGDISESTSEAYVISQGAGSVSSESATIIQQAIDGIQEIAVDVKQASHSVVELGKGVSEIEGIIGIIKEISDQTNLLALNAAIEAARAGEVGRGFAVVADEVRKLADRTTDSTREIAERISHIRSHTQNAISGIERGVKQVESGTLLAREAAQAITKIRDSSQNIVSSVGNINEHLSAQSQVSHNVTSQISTMTQMARQSSTATDETLSNAEQLRTLAHSLKQAIAEFELGNSSQAAS